MSNDDNKTTMVSDLLNEYAAAKFLTVSVSTVRRWRYEGGGPAMVRMRNAIRYRRADLQRFIDSSTSEG